MKDSWGRVEINLINDNWEIDENKLEALNSAKDRWRLANENNKKRGIGVSVVGTSNGKGKVKVTSMHVQVWLSESDAGKLTSDGLKLRLVNIGFAQVASGKDTFTITGRVMHAGETKETCLGQFEVQGQQKFKARSSQNVIRVEGNKCSNGTGCWSDCTN